MSGERQLLLVDSSRHCYQHPPTFEREGRGRERGRERGRGGRREGQQKNATSSRRQKHCNGAVQYLLEEGVGIEGGGGGRRENGWAGIGGGSKGGRSSSKNARLLRAKGLVSVAIKGEVPSIQTVSFSRLYRWEDKEPQYSIRKT